MVKIKTETLTVMFIDMVDYTKTTSNLDRNRFNELHDLFDSYVYEVITEYDGTMIKKLGDAFLITFKSSTDAVLCGNALQKKFSEHNEFKREDINLKIAIHGGEVVHRHGDIYGDAVNITSRIDSIVKLGDVVFSELVYSSMNKNEVDYKYIGEFMFKGSKHPIKLFKIKTKKDYLLENRLRKINKIRKIKRWTKFIFYKMIFLFAIVILVYFIITNLDYMVF